MCAPMTPNHPRQQTAAALVSGTSKLPDAVPAAQLGRYGWSPDWFLNEKPLQSGLPTAYPCQKKFNSRLVAPTKKTLAICEGSY
jgi:hypothetical protein